MNQKAVTMLEKVTALHDLRNPVISVVLHALEEVQTMRGIAQSGDNQAWDNLLEQREYVLRLVIEQMYAAAVYQEKHNYQPGCSQLD